MFHEIKVGNKIAVERYMSVWISPEIHIFPEAFASLIFQIYWLMNYPTNLFKMFIVITSWWFCNDKVDREHCLNVS